MQKPELLAPAGSIESLRAAVYCGANAVYLGAKTLNARRNAGNFDEIELRQAVEFCHERDVKVYQTLNILMFDKEAPELLSAVRTACDLGIDAVLVQDLGVLSIIRKIAPELPVYASTQMAVHNLAGVRQAAALGCQRAVLARELSLGEIAHITKYAPIPVEAFVHGALCMCVSGQCYLSAMVGQRSGNRGLCAQPCRLPFAVGDASHALSLKDLSAANDIAALAQTGVASLKIEGRMKRPEYVAAAVTAIRAALDGKEPDLDTLQKVFSRSGFTNGYLLGKLDENMFGFRQKEDVVAATEVLGALSQLAAKETPRVPLSAEFFARHNEPMRLTIRDNRGNRCDCIGEAPEIALQKPTDEERLRQSLCKTGGTPYFFEEITVTLEEGLLLKASQINAMRRDALEQIAAMRRTLTPFACKDRLPVFPAAKSSGQHPALRVHAALAQLSQEAIANTDEFILPLGDCKQALQTLPAEKILAEIPRILFQGEEQVATSLQELRQAGITRAYAQNVGALLLAKQAGMQMEGGWALNVANSHCASALEQADAQSLELSLELLLSDAKKISAARRGIIAYGSLPLMVFRNCPVKARIGCENCRQQGKLTDRMGVSFRVGCESGSPELYNSVPLYLADRRDELHGFNFVTLWFTDETKAHCEEQILQYRGKRETQKIQSGHTRGLYYRGVI